MTNQFKSSFPPIADEHIKILILGSLPGDKSLAESEYYAHPRNRFWKVLAEITSSIFPTNYEAKLKMLSENKIGVWDVVQKAQRVGSLDTNILDEVPNNLDEFIANHPNLEIIVFNGSKSQKLYDKYFKRQPNVKYLEMPSTSPANANYTFERLCEKWKEIVS